MTDEEMANYSAALDEIWRLRRALAYEAAALLVDLSYASFPKSRRQFANDSVKRMQASARGWVQAAYGQVSSLSLRHSMREAKAPDTLTRAQWEDSLPKRGQHG